MASMTLINVFAFFFMHNVCSVLQKLPVAVCILHGVCKIALYSLKFALEHQLIV